MVVNMKFEESSLTRYLVKNLQPLTEADPVILAEYVAALLKKDKPIEELQQLCSEKLVEFLGQGTNSFITKLFHSLEDGSIVEAVKGLDSIKTVGPSPSLTTEDLVELKNLSSRPEGSPSSGHGSDSEEKEASDDNDDDRNHKHRRRETPSQSFDNEVNEQHLRRLNRKRNRPFENGRMFRESNLQPSENRKEYNPGPLERDLYVKFEKRRPGLGPLPRAPLDLGQRARSSQAFHGDPSFRFDLSTSLSCLPIERGRGRGLAPWSQHDSRFSSVDPHDFSSQMTVQGHLPPSLFTGRGLQDAASTLSASWGAFGLVPGMPNGGLDTFHPFLQGTLRRPINPTLSIGIPRQRCKDFEERGFCLRGDMCPMEHGVNRIVVEDVQSLSQFNLPVSLPSAHLLGTPAGMGPLSSVNAPSSLLTNSKDLQGKSSKPGTSNDGLDLNRVLSTSASAGDPDLYDPDQPLWSTDRPETSSALLRLPSPRIDETEPLWDADFSDRANFRLSDDRECPTTSSVWGRIGNSGNKIEMAGKTDGCLQNEPKENEEQELSGVPANGHQRKWTVSEDVGSEVMKSVAGNVGRTPQKALRTLFVNNIPLKNNKREALLSHFQKFGEVIDIYIPLNSERAFVQFSKREEAEAALKAPDAVMGNRFIKLWWANRDSVPVDSASSGANTASAVPSGVTSVSNRGKENLPSIAPKVGSAPGMTNGPKAPPSSQKKLDNLELLKEEIRLKQERLDQKRIDFRRKLYKLEKQAITVKGEVTVEQGIKRHKVAMVNDVARSSTPRSTNHGTTGARPAEKTLDKDNSGESIVSPTSKTNPTMVLQSPRSSRLPNRLSAPGGTPFLVNRFKLDNRPTTFRILPPIPADFANVTVLKEHFSPFGDLSTVELEELEVHTGAVHSKPSENCCALITFTTRRSAERAFSNGKCLQGYNLQFSWLTTSSHSSNNYSGREHSPTTTPKGSPNADVVANIVTSGSSSSSTGKSICSVSQVESTNGNGEPLDSEGIKGGAEPMELVEACQSNPVTISSCETGSSEADIVNHEDGLNVEIAQ